MAGGGAYYFAKRQVNADRYARHEADQKRKARYRNIEPVTPMASSSGSTKKKASSTAVDQEHSASPSAEASQDPAPIDHTPKTKEPKARMRSKYEATEQYINNKGDRFS